MLGIVKYYNKVVAPFHPEWGRFNELSDNPGKIVCPFHDDVNPSLGVIPGTEVFHCFGCHAHGDVIDMHSRLRGISKDSALQELRYLFPEEFSDESSGACVSKRRQRMSTILTVDDFTSSRYNRELKKALAETSDKAVFNKILVRRLESLIK